MQNITILATSNAMKEPDILWGFNEGKIRNLVGDDDDDNNDGFDDYDDDDNNVCDHDNDGCDDHMDGDDDKNPLCYQEPKGNICNLVNSSFSFFLCTFVFLHLHRALENHSVYRYSAFFMLLFFQTFDNVVIGGQLLESQDFFLTNEFVQDLKFES